MNGDNNDVTVLPNLFLNDDNLKFSTSTSRPAIDSSASNRLTHFDTLFNNNQSLLGQSLNRPRIRSTSPLQQPPANELNAAAAKPRSGGSTDEPPAVLEKRQNGPFMDDIYSGLLQLISGSLKVNRSPGNTNQPMNGQSMPLLPQNLLNNPNLKPFLMNNPHLLNNNLLSQLPNRINNRLPNGAPLNNIQNLPNGFIVGPSNRPPSLPLHFAKPQPTANRPLTNSSPNPQQQQFNNQLLHQLLLKPGAASQLNLTALPINNILNNMIANNQTLDQILPNSVLNASAPKNYIKVEQAEVSRLLLGSSSSKPTRNEIVFSSTATSSLLSPAGDDSLNSIDSIHFPNELFARTSINRTLNENQLLSTLNANRPMNAAKPAVDIHRTKSIDKVENLFELSNATVLSNNHYSNRFPFNRTQLTSSFSSIDSASLNDMVAGTVQLNTNQLLNSINQASSTPASTTIWKPFDKFDMFNTNNNLIKPTRTAWEGNPPDIITKPEEASTFDITVRNKMGTNESRIDLVSEGIRPTMVAGLHESSSSAPPSKEPEVVYGRPANRPANNLPADQLRPGLVNSVNPQSTTQATITSVTLNQQQKATPSLPAGTIHDSPAHDSVGRPLVYPVEMDLVKPQVATNQLPSSSVSIITESGGGSVYIDAQQKHFKLKPIQKTNTIPSMQIGSTMNVYGNNNNNLDSRKSGSSLSSSNPINPFASLNVTNANSADKPRINQVRRPTFRPKPATPLVRIDTCIGKSSKT